MSFDPPGQLFNQLLYTESSQFRKWMISVQDLSDRRSKVTREAIQRAKGAWQIEIEVREIISYPLILVTLLGIKS